MGLPPYTENENFLCSSVENPPLDPACSSAEWVFFPIKWMKIFCARARRILPWIHRAQTRNVSSSLYREWNFFVLEHGESYLGFSALEHGMGLLPYYNIVNGNLWSGRRESTGSKIRESAYRSIGVTMFESNMFRIMRLHFQNDKPTSYRSYLFPQSY